MSEIFEFKLSGALLTVPMNFVDFRNNQKRDAKVDVKMTSLQKNSIRDLNFAPLAYFKNLQRTWTLPKGRLTRIGLEA